MASYLQMHPPLVFLMIMFAIRGANAACYYPDGTEQINGNPAPCDGTNGTASMCCDLVNTTRASPCTADGLCIPYDNIELWRGPCTDRSWKDPACLRLCIDGIGKKELLEGVVP